MSPSDCPALLDVPDDRAAIADRGPHMDLGMLRVERGQQGREEAFPGDRACRDRQVAGHRRMKAAEVPSSLFVEIEDLASELIEPLTGFGEGDPPGPTVEQRDPQLSFEGGDPLADGRLSDPRGRPRQP